MVRKEAPRYREHVQDGRGTLAFYDVVTKDELYGHGRLYARIVMPPGSSIGFHIHHGETEPYYILKGEGDFIDNDHSVTHVVPGDVCFILPEQGHSIENNGTEDLEFMALVYNAEGINT